MPKGNCALCSANSRIAGSNQGHMRCRPSARMVVGVAACKGRTLFSSEMYIMNFPKKR